MAEDEIEKENQATIEKLKAEVDQGLIMSDQDYIEKKEFKEATLKVVFEAASACVFLSMKNNNQYEADAF